MRWLIMIGVIVLLQALNYGLSWGLHWLVRPWWFLSFRSVAIGCFLLSNLLFLSVVVGGFRLSVGWFALLWIGMLGAIVAIGTIFLLQKMGVHSPAMARTVAVLCVTAMLGWAVFNAYMPVVRTLTIRLDKPLPVPVKIAVASDLHLGAMFGVRELELLETLLKQNQVDILLMPGDIMDDNTEGFEKYQMAKQFATTLRAVSGVAVASLGNHDLYQTQAFDAITTAITQGGAILLDDKTQVVSIHKAGKTSHIQLVGRFDDHHSNRLSTQALLEQADTRLPVILLDHRPSQIEQNTSLPIDLQVSGHTHNGQVFPANLIVHAINRLGYGYEQINDTHVVVSSGYGFWGIPFRLGSRSEIWVIELTGTPSD